jgi:hypothetical protein
MAATGRATIVAALFVAASSAAAAQDVGQPNAPDYRLVATACQEDYSRFCEHQGDPVPSPRIQAICLKNFRSDLSLGCRRALAAVSGE